MTAGSLNLPAIPLCIYRYRPEVTGVFLELRFDARRYCAISSKAVASEPANARVRMLTAVVRV